MRLSETLEDIGILSSSLAAKSFGHLSDTDQRMPRRSTVHLSDILLRKLPSPHKNGTIVYDNEVPGFGIRVTKTGRKSFVLNYGVAGLERRITIGEYPAWSTVAARSQAQEFRRLIRNGIDPINDRAAKAAETLEDLTAPTIADLFERYAEEHLPHKSSRSAKDDRSMWKKLIIPKLGNIRVKDLTASDVDALHAEITKSKPVRANRTVEVLRKALNLAIRWKMRSDNPASGVRRNPEHKRTRFLTPAEVLKLVDALSNHPETTSADAIRLLLLTGARKSEVLTATWDMFDLERGVWTKPSSHTKQRREHRVPISQPAIRLLQEIKRKALQKAEDSGVPIPETVFPGGAEGPLKDVRKTWISVCKSCGFAAEVPKRGRNGKVLYKSNGKPVLHWQPTVRIHDLRHTYASVLASEGISLPIVGALLGHTQVQTTLRYAHLYDDPLRIATERVAAALKLSIGDK